MAEILNEPCGVLIVNKPQGPTSHDIVNRVRRLYSTKKVGHTGTLDPMATGVLVVLIGRAAKACEYSLSDRKIYTATLRLGVETDTEDTTGNIRKKYPVTVNEKDVKDVLSGFKGRIKQIPQYARQRWNILRSLSPRAQRCRLRAQYRKAFCRQPSVRCT